MSEIYLLELAEQIGSEWLSLGINLGFSLPQLQHVMSDYRNDMVSQIHTMLVIWRRKQPPKDIAGAVGSLAKGLEDCGRVDLSHFVRLSLTERN